MEEVEAKRKQDTESHWQQTTWQDNTGVGVCDIFQYFVMEETQVYFGVLIGWNASVVVVVVATSNATRETGKMESA